jgi:hypothetical protein
VWGWNLVRVRGKKEFYIGGGRCSTDWETEEALEQIHQSQRGVVRSAIAPQPRSAR